MGTIHRLIDNHGKQGALLLGADRRVVEAAAAYMGEEDTGIGFLYSGWCQAALPHKKLADDEEWQIRSDHISMVVQPGLRPSRSGRADRVGVPYGSRARLIMFYIQSEAIRTNSRDVELGRTLNHWMFRMGIPVGGKSVLSIKDQAERISLCNFTFDGHGIARGAVRHRMTIFDKEVFVDMGDVPGQSTLFPQVARLSEAFYEALSSHPVPLDEAAVCAISNNSMALDLYAWLAYRLHILKGPTPVSWSALKSQFGVGFVERHHFRSRFIANLELALAVYRAASVDVTERGVTLNPSRPPVEPRIVTTARAANRARVQTSSTARAAAGQLQARSTASAYENLIGRVVTLPKKPR